MRCRAAPRPTMAPTVRKPSAPKRPPPQPPQTSAAPPRGGCAAGGPRARAGVYPSSAPPPAPSPAPAGMRGAVATALLGRPTVAPAGQPGAGSAFKAGPPGAGPACGPSPWSAGGPQLVPSKPRPSGRWAGQAGHPAPPSAWLSVAGREWGSAPREHSGAPRTWRSASSALFCARTGAGPIARARHCRNASSGHAGVPGEPPPCSTPMGLWPPPLPRPSRQPSGLRAGVGGVGRRRPPAAPRRLGGGPPARLRSSIRFNPQYARSATPP